MTCEKCGRQTDGVIGGYELQAGAVWCVDCVRAAGINVPHVLTVRYAGDGMHDRAALLAQKAAERRAKDQPRFDAMRAKAKQAAVAPVRHQAAAGVVQLGFQL